MAYSIVINGTDRTSDIINESVVVEDVVNDQVNTCDVVLLNRSGSGIPETDEEIIITLADGTKLFAGYIIKVDLTKSEYGSVSAGIHAVDYTRLLDRNLVHDSYEDMTCKEIIQDIIATYCAGFGITTTNVADGPTIDQIAFNYIQPSQAFRKLAELSGYNWYIDYDKDIFFNALVTDAAPFDIDSTNNDYAKLKITKDSSQLKNRIYVRGGTKLSDTTTYQEKGDGVKRKFVIPDKPHNVSISVGGVSKTLGIKNIDTSGYDWYLNFEEKYIEQDSGAVVLGTSDTVTISYQYDIPILVAQENTASIAANGVKEFPIFDKTITTTTAARDRGIAELTDYANDLVEGRYQTYTAAFRSGQYQNINLTEYDINDDYLIQKVTARSIGAGEFVYDISIASAKTIGIIKFLINLLDENRRLIELDDSEVVDELLSVSDSLNADSLVDALTTDSAGPYSTWALASEATPLTTARWGLFQWG